jgi:hypothetical protein
MKLITSICVFAIIATGPALADENKKGGKLTEAEIRSGSVIDDGLDIPKIRPGTQYFEIHGSTRIAHALGEFRLPTDDAGLAADSGSHNVRQAAAAW